MSEDGVSFPLSVMDKQVSVESKLLSSMESSFRRNVRGGIEQHMLEELTLRWRRYLYRTLVIVIETRWVRFVPIKVNIFIWRARQMFAVGVTLFPLAVFVMEKKDGLNMKEGIATRVNLEESGAKCDVNVAATFRVSLTIVGDLHMLIKCIEDGIHDELLSGMTNDDRLKTLDALGAICNSIKADNINTDVIPCKVSFFG
ncbi:hypothetical protein Tco_0290515 [Tanacetum coccineum]